jgi:hypothetical protein
LSARAQAVSQGGPSEARRVRSRLAIFRPYPFRLTRRGRQAWCDPRPQPRFLEWMLTPVNTNALNTPFSPKHLSPSQSPSPDRHATGARGQGIGAIASCSGAHRGYRASIIACKTRVLLLKMALSPPTRPPASVRRAVFRGWRPRTASPAAILANGPRPVLGPPVASWRVFPAAVRTDHAML